MPQLFSQILKHNKKQYAKMFHFQSSNGDLRNTAQQIVHVSAMRRRANVVLSSIPQRPHRPLRLVSSIWQSLLSADFSTSRTRPFSALVRRVWPVRPLPSFSFSLPTSYHHFSWSLLCDGKKINTIHYDKKLNFDIGNDLITVVD